MSTDFLGYVKAAAIIIPCFALLYWRDGRAIDAVSDVVGSVVKGVGVGLLSIVCAVLSAIPTIIVWHFILKYW